MKAINLKYHSSDNGNCRVYYTHKSRLYCFQIENYRAKTFSLLTCTRDGEPECPVNMRFIGNVGLPKCDETIGAELAQFMTSPAWREINREYTH
jgi:hypothetical protein